MAEVPHTDLSREEFERIASKMPADIFIAEAIGRGANFIGLLTVAAANANGDLLPVSYEDRVFKRSVGNFINPDERVDLQDQLELMNDLWQRLGITPPTPSDAQMETMARAVDLYPDRRIVPTPLLIVEDRVAVVAKGRELPGQQLRTETEGEALWVPDSAANYGKALLNPYSIVTDDSDSSVKYGLRYKAPNGDPEPLDRKSYENQLVLSGQAIVDEVLSLLWTYPIIDVRVKAERNTGKDTANNIYRNRISPFLSPESLLVIQLLHQVTGLPNPDWSYDISNEALYKVDEHGKALSLVRVNGAKWEATEQFIRSGGIDEHIRTARLGIRATDSALKVAA